MQGTHFYDRLIEQYTFWEQIYTETPHLLKSSPTQVGNYRRDDNGRTEPLSETRKAYTALRSILQDPNTKRLVFDARQAKIFAEETIELPDDLIGRIHMPFDQFYLELTEPIELAEQEPGYEGDLLRGFLFTAPDVRKLTWLDSDGESRVLDIAHITAFFTRTDERGHLEYTDRTWFMNLEIGAGFVRKAFAVQEPDPSELPDDMPLNAYILAGQDMQALPNRYIGWLEDAIAQYSRLFLWMMAYLMAKSIKIVEETMSRQVKRALTRQGQVPRPWHVIRVEPQFLSAHASEETERSHGYRYDVIGHLRFGKHKLGNGEYRSTIEWVTAHQRGLRHSRYIPKTYRVEGGKKISERMGEYWTTKKESNA